MKVSVIIPAYNCGSMISRCVCSVFEQSVPANEIVIVDDGSSDDTAKRCRQLAEGDSRVKFVQQENGGAAAARNTGLHVAQSEWVAFLDSDDSWSRDKLEKQIQFVCDHPEIRWVASAYRLVKLVDSRPVNAGDSAVDGVVLRNGEAAYDALSLLAGRTSLWTGTIMMHRSSVASLDGFSTELQEGEDSDLWIRFALVHPMIGFLPETLSQYTVSQSTSLTGQSARAIHPSKFVYFDKLMSYAINAETKQQSIILKRILQTKVDSASRCLLRTGSMQQARKLHRDLRQRELPLPNVMLRIGSLLPSWPIRLLRYLFCR